MKNSRKHLFVFAVISLALITLLSVFSSAWLQAVRETKRIEEIDKEAVNMPYYRKITEQLGNYYEKISGTSASPTNGPEFYSRLPQTASRFGIRDIVVENLGARKSGSGEITEIRISSLGSFGQMYTFLSELENGAWPLQIRNLEMKNENGRIRSVMVVRLYRSTPEGK